MGIFSKFKNGLQRGADVLHGAINKVVGREQLDENDLLDLEEAFYQSDFGVDTTEEIISKIREYIEVKRNLGSMPIVLPVKF